MSRTTTMESCGGGNSSSSAAGQRLRWTNELHERFVDAVAQLGGPDSKIFYMFLCYFKLLVFVLELCYNFSFFVQLTCWILFVVQPKNVELLSFNLFRNVSFDYGVTRKCFM